MTGGRLSRIILGNKYMKEFDEFWELYPHGRRRAKGKCRPKYAKLVRKGLHPKIIEALHLQIKAYNTKIKDKTKTKDFVADWKLSETWLNGECWDDDVPTRAVLQKNRYSYLDIEKTPAQKEMEREQEKIHADKSWTYLAKVANMSIEDFKQQSLERWKKKYGK